MKFEGGNRQSFNLSLHSQFHFLQYGLVKAVDQTKLKIPAAVMSTWEASNKSETQLDQESTASEHTAKLLALDNERDNLLVNIFYVVRGYRFSNETSKKEAALRLSAKLKPYTGLRNLPFEMESARIRGLEDDISTMAADISAVGLTSTFAQLHTANEAYETLRMTRRTTSTDTKLPNAREVRAVADEAYDVVCQYIQAAYLYATADEDKTLIEQLVDRMNKVTADIKTTQRQILANRKPKDPKNPKDPKDPKQPKDPKDPKKPEGGGDDIHIPEEPPKKPNDAEQPQPGPGGSTGGGDDIQIPSEPPKKPEGEMTSSPTITC